MLKRFLFLAASGLIAAGPASAAGDLEAGEKIFKRCMACHAVGADAKNKVGPALNGIVGQAWGQVADYKYSDGKDGALLTLAASGDKVWDVPTLDAYLLKPKDVIPDGKMAFPGLRKDEDRLNVITYLASFDSDGNETDPEPVMAEHTPSN